MNINFLLTPELLYQTIMLSTPLIFASLGAYISRKADVINLGIEGIMLIGSLIGVLVSGFFIKVGLSYTVNLTLTFFILILIGLLCGYFIGIFHLKFKADVGLVGIMFNMIASGLTIYLLVMFTGEKGSSSKYPSLNFPKIDIPIIKNIPFVGEILSGHYLLTYVAIILVIVVRFIMNKTTIGLRIRAVGENADAITSVGLSESRLKLMAISISGGFATLGGATLSMCIFNGFIAEMVAGRGFIALSADTLGGSAFGGFLVSLLFGFAESISISLQLYTKIPTQFVDMIPYMLTIIALVVYSYNKKVTAIRKVVKNHK